MLQFGILYINLYHLLLTTTLQSTFHIFLMRSMLREISWLVWRSSAGQGQNWGNWLRPEYWDCHELLCAFLLFLLGTEPVVVRWIYGQIGVSCVTLLEQYIGVFLPKGKSMGCDIHCPFTGKVLPASPRGPVHIPSLPLAAILLKQCAGRAGLWAHWCPYPGNASVCPRGLGRFGGLGQPSDWWSTWRCFR